MAIWIEENLPPLLLGFGLGAVACEFFLSANFAWIWGGLAGVGIALPIWQINRRRWLSKK